MKVAQPKSSVDRERLERITRICQELAGLMRDFGSALGVNSDVAREALEDLVVRVRQAEEGS